MGSEVNIKCGQLQIKMCSTLPETKLKNGKSSRACAYVVNNNDIVAKLINNKENNKKTNLKNSSIFNINYTISHNNHNQYFPLTTTLLLPALVHPGRTLHEPQSLTSSMLNCTQRGKHHLFKCNYQMEM